MDEKRQSKTNFRPKAGVAQVRAEPKMNLNHPSEVKKPVSAAIDYD